MLSVVQTVASLNSLQGGISRVIPALSDALEQRGCRVTVVYLDDSARASHLLLPKRAATSGARPFRFLGRSLWSPGLSQQIGQGFAIGARPLLHDNGLWGYTNLVAARYAARHGIPLVISPHGMLEPWALAHKPLRKRIALALFQRKALRSAALLMVTAPSELAAVRAAGLTQPVAIVPVGIDIPATRARHGGSTAVRRLLFLSRIHPKKGLLALVEAWCQVGRPGWEIVIAGPDEGGHTTEVRDLVTRLGLNSQFKFIGEVAGAQKRELFESADVFVLPTFSENFGLAVAEAMSYALPVLTTRGAPWSILETIDAGWWVQPGVDGLMHGLRQVLDTTVQQREAMGSAGRDYVARQLDWEVIATLTLAAYEWVLGLRAERPSHIQLA